ncbi:DUF2264 domain-containing protein [Halosolutus gelatinilyticus]|uniref:DUF2264 domain-containing protein n=1 Tax=Halosolutus gelatinilyticus TaxID=2931975 RepID=UPI001FF2D699|nr:DUF2264 domain-containing protein [Halosolutus gelatinilyticus]
MNPVAENPLRTRTDFERAVEQLVDPLLDHASPGGARVRPTATGAWFPDVDADLEGFARPLWGIVPLSVHSTFDRWPRIRRGLVNGTDPAHDEYWGDAGDGSQKHVEMAAIGLGLVLTPERMWDPLSESEREQLVRWLNGINDAELHDCNWLFFRVMVNTGLRSVGATHDWEFAQSSLDRLESFYRGDGWYADGPEGSAIDYYVPWAMHYYGLAYASVCADEDPDRARRFRERAAEFATDYVDWFDGDGRALPYGRSLTYRFAQAAFWGALAYADVHPLPWGVIRGLWARNIRWWLNQPIFTDGGLLSVGYRYPTLKMSEPYNSPNSPYWALKAFLPLALEPTHPFWRADEEPLPDRLTTTTQPEAGKVICRDDGHLFALSLPRDSPYGPEKYAKFAYSATFGFSVAGRNAGPGRAGHDSSLALSVDGDRYTVPESVAATEVDGTTLKSLWTPWDDVTVETWVAPALPWHVRVHRLETSRPIHVEEGGFPLDRTGDDDATRFTHETEGATARATYPNGTSAIADLRADRRPTIVSEEPNANLMHPRTVVPTLRKRYDAGDHWLAAAVRAAPDGSADAVSTPELVATGDRDRVTIETAAGDRLLECRAGEIGSAAEGRSE